jgi:hypothetical protein
MSSQGIRWVIAGLFVAFLVVVVLSDLINRRPKKSKIKPQPRPRGFRPVPTDKPSARPSWKASGRR